MKDFAGAIADLDRAIELDPGSPFSWIARGQTRIALGDPEGAIADLEEALRLDPANPKPRELIAKAKKMQQQRR